MTNSTREVPLIHDILDMMQDGLAVTSLDVAYAINEPVRKVSNLVSSYSKHGKKKIVCVDDTRKGYYRYKITDYGLLYLKRNGARLAISNRGPITVNRQLWDLHTKIFRPWAGELR